LPRASTHRRASGAARAWGFHDLSHALELIANPAACKQRLDALGAKTAETAAEIAEAKKQQAALVAAEKAHRQMLETTSAEHAATLAAERQTFDEQRLRQENALTAREARLGEQESKLEADREALEELHNDLQARAAAFARATEPMRSGRKPA
jgi:DNA repair exonuclease SbcCD ATPase subunit